MSFYNKYKKYKSLYKRLTGGTNISNIPEIHSIMWSNYKNTRKSVEIDFLTTSSCKIINSFDGNEIERSLIKWFISYNDNQRNNIITFLFGIHKYKIGYFICSNNTNVFFYHKQKLNILLRCLSDNNINVLENQLLEMPCTWNRDREPLEDQLIHILFGNIDICTWSTHSKKDIPYKLEDLLPRLRDAYKQFLRMYLT